METGTCDHPLTDTYLSVESAGSDIDPIARRTEQRSEEPARGHTASSERGREGAFPKGGSVVSGVRVDQ